MSFKLPFHHLSFRNWIGGWTKVVAALTTLFAVSGCSLFFDDEVKPKEPIYINSAENQRTCLSRSLEVVANFFDAKAEEVETDTIVDCAVNSLDTFVAHTKPIDGTERYSREALASFIERYFLEGGSTDRDLMALVFRLKASVIGGDDQEISKEELRQIRAMILSFKSVASTLKPFADLYGLRAPPKEAPLSAERLEGASRALMDAVELINGEIRKSDAVRADFSRADFETLLAQGEITASVASYSSLAGLFKQLFVRPPEDRIEGADWPLLLETAAKMYSFYLRYHYVLESHGWWESSATAQWEVIFAEGTELLQRSLKRRANAAIPLSELESLAQELKKTELVDETFPIASVLPVAFRWKASLIGGTATSLQSLDLAHLRQIAITGMRGLGNLHPYRDVLSFSAPTSTPPSRLDEGVHVLQSVVARLGEDLRSFGPRPDLPEADVRALLERFATTRGWNRYVPLGGHLKQILIRAPADRVASEDWPFVLSTLSGLVELGLRYQLYIHEISPLTEPDLSQIEVFARRALEIVASGLDHRQSGIQSSEFEGLIDEVDRIELLPEKLRPESVKALIWPLSARLFRDPTRSSPRRGTAGMGQSAPTSFGLAEIRRLQLDLEDWIAGHRLSAAVSETAERYYRAPEIASRFNNGGLEGKIPQPQGVKVVRDARRQMAQLLARGRLLAWDSDNRLLIIRRDESRGIRRQDLFLLNLIRSAMRVVVRGYSGSPDRAASLAGLTEDEMQEFYLDFREAGIDLDLMDSRVFTAGSRSFMEANLFTSVGDGNSLVTIHELTEFFQFVFSAGTLVEKFRQGVIDAGCAARDLDFSGLRPLLGPACVRLHLRSRFDSYFSNLPGMTKYFRGLRDDDESWKDFLTALEEASRAGGFNEDSYDESDIRVISQVLHYAESLFVNFDNDRNGTLDEKEIWDAFPKFRAFIRKLGEGQAETLEIQQTIFSFMITFGRAPSIGFGGKLELGGWALGRRLVSESADRLDVLKIMASIGSHGRQVRLAQIEAYFKKNSSDLQRRLWAAETSTVKEFAELFTCPSMVETRLRITMRANAETWLLPPSREEVLQEVCGDPNWSCEEADQPGIGQLSSRKFAERVNATIKGDATLKRSCWPLF